jgi:APA family basic amino acid/polyamine antiporter
VLRVKHPELHRPFKTPLVPLVPLLSIVSALYLMSRLGAITWLRLIGWLIFGLIIYFSYSVRHSKVQKLAKADAAD